MLGSSYMEQFLIRSTAAYSCMYAMMYAIEVTCDSRAQIRSYVIAQTRVRLQRASTCNVGVAVCSVHVAREQSLARTRSRERDGTEPHLLAVCRQGGRGESELR